MSMTEFQTVFGSLKDYTKGELQIINDNPKYYTFSNVFDVANRSKPYEKVVVAMNLEYVIETLRAEGTSDWYTAAHDEFCIVMDGEVEVELVQLEAPVTAGKGSVKVSGEPKGRKMGWMKLKRGHQGLLPHGAAYRFKAKTVGVMLMQTIKGSLSVEKWAEICYT
jgi:hypothetical protein